MDIDIEGFDLIRTDPSILLNLTHAYARSAIVCMADMEEDLSNSPYHYFFHMHAFLCKKMRVQVQAQSWIRITSWRH